LLLSGELNGRFIPTGVGNIMINEVITEDVTVHPHGCGEHIMVQDNANHTTGSSPRVWGTFSLSDGSILELRFIPTGVGNINKHQSRSNLHPVHPHGCGEYRPMAPGVWA